MSRRPGADGLRAPLRAAAPRTLTALVAAVLAVPAAGQPAVHTASAHPVAAAPFTYAAGTRHYRITSVDTRTQNQAGGRAPFEFTTTTTQFVTLTLASRTRDTVALTLTLDKKQKNTSLIDEQSIS